MKGFATGRQGSIIGLVLVTAMIGILMMLNPAFSSVAQEETAVPVYTATPSSIYLPFLKNGAAPLCRFGVNALEDPNLTNLPSTLRVGWYMNFHAEESPPRPDSMEYMPVIRLQPTANDGYTYTPNGSILLNAIATNPGAKWLISNEPDSIWQDNLEPQIYAQAYHELYYLIKDADPTAQIIAGSIVQATPLRLLYLDMILDSYMTEFGESMPTDGWSIHNYILNEASCSFDPDNCWGADIPPGIDAGEGERWGLRDNDRVDVFIARIVRFRQWLADHGYTGQPVYVTEYGVLLPEDYIDEDGNPFSPARVTAFMAGTYDYMLAATDPQLGDPNDDYRLVQQWSWFSTTDLNYNGTLFDPETYERTAIGNFFKDYTMNLPELVDLYPTELTSTIISQTQTVTLTLTAHIANSGNLSSATYAYVYFYDGNPDQGGQQISTPQEIYLSGCGDNQDISVLWSDVTPGTYTIYVRVDTPTAETDTANNMLLHQIQVDALH